MTPGPSRMKLNVVELSERSATDDFKTMVLKALGALSAFKVLGAPVLGATYVQPRKTAGGIIIPEKTVDEDRWQGKLNLVLKLGESAFKFDGAYPYEGTVPAVGDYVVAHTSDTREIGIRGVSCRTIPCSLIRLIVPDPDAIF